MPLPGPIAVEEDAYRIALGHAEDYVYDDILPVPPTSGETQAIWFSSVYLVPGEGSPRLYRAESSDTPNSIAAWCLRLCTDNVPTPQYLAYSEARTLATKIGESADEYEEEEEVHDAQFKTLGLVAVYYSDAGPSARLFASLPFLGVMTNQLQTSRASLEDEELREMYDMRKEHDADIAPYELWRVETENLIRSFHSDPQAQLMAAMSHLSYLLIPFAKVDKIFEDTLFEAQGQITE